MELIDIGGHTIDKSILGDGCIIDVGCRGFVFADYFKDNIVLCIDPDPDVFKDRPRALNQIFINMAIAEKKGEATYYKNGEATCLQEKWAGHGDEMYGTCKTTTMEQLYKELNQDVDVLKLDCEGGEYIILGETFKPIPKQITVEFHYHCFPEKHNQLIGGILKRLDEYYDVVNLKWEPRHGAGFNYWDTLFIRRDCKK